MKNFILMCLLFLCGISTTFSQKPGDGIRQRLTFNFPVFTFTPCTPFLAEFGSSESTIKTRANEAGIIFHSRLEMKMPEGSYILAYYDTDKMATEKGEVLASPIVYLFSFTKNAEYFGFSIRVSFSNIHLANSFYGTLLKQVESTWGTTKSPSGSTIGICSDKNMLMYGKKLTVDIRTDGKDLNMGIIDFSTIESLYSK